MELQPRYDGPPLLRLDGEPGDVAGPLLRQRRRFADLLATLSADEWAAPSRCEAWTVKDVVAHLVDTNRFWVASMQAGLAGEPTRFLTGFDPVTTPALLVDAGRSSSAEEVLAQFVETEEAMAFAADLDDDAWAVTAEAPPGHIPMWAVASHALWDAWVHERDVVLPLGRRALEEPDEVAVSLRYAVALGPALLATTGSTRAGTLGVRATRPDVALVVELGDTVVVREGPAPAGAPVLTGDAVDLVEAMSFRSPLVHDLVADDQWMLGGLAAVFDLV